MAKKAMRTKSGHPSAAARKAHGDKEGRYPIFDAKSARAAKHLARTGHVRSESEKKKIVSRANRFLSKKKG